jgi:uncharacterized protein YecE (DUF72 family)
MASAVVDRQPTVDAASAGLLGAGSRDACPRWPAPLAAADGSTFFAHDGQAVSLLPCVGDVFRSNVLLRAARPVALLDWEEARLDWQAADVAGAAWEFAKVSDWTPFHAAAGRAVVHAYRTAGGTVPPTEDDLLVPLIRVRRMLEVLRAPYDRYVDWDYQLRKLDASTTLPERGRLYAGASGFSYASWRSGFYPVDAKPPDFLRLYAERLGAVELNNSFYRLPAEGQFQRWAEQTPASFRFAVKMPRSVSIFGNLGGIGTFVERVGVLGERLGAALVRLADDRPRDDGFLELLLGSLEPGLRVALDARDPSWEGADARLDVAGAIRVNALEGAAGFRYLRLREPPYSNDDLAHLGKRVDAMLDEGLDVFCFFRHEDEPTAPRYAARLQELVRRGRS